MVVMRCPWCHELAGSGLRCAACSRQLRPERQLRRPSQHVSFRGRVKGGLFVGQSYRGYRFDGLIGEGRTHDVYVATDKAACAFAFKMPRIALGPDSVTLAERDYAILRQLDDPHLARIHDVQMRDELPHCVVELVDAEPLTEKLPLPWSRVADIIRQLCGPLHALAERGFLSRKLSLDKLYVESRPSGMPSGDPYRGLVSDRTDFVKLVLGSNVGTWVPSLDTAVQSYVGALEWMSPELLGGARAGETSYVYTLGAFAYFMLTGQLPFRDVSLAGRIVFAAAPIVPPSQRVPDVPPAVDDLIATCLDVDPTARYPTTLVLRDAVTALR